jgi:hypothetical protein
MSEAKELLDKLEHLKSILQPTAPEMNEAEHVKAHVRVAFESLYYIFFDMNKLLQYSLKPKNEQNATDEELLKMQESAKTGIDKFVDLMDNEELDPWEQLVSKEYMENFKQGIEEMHGGNCTAYPCSCMRCLSETYYKLPNSVTWGKSKGSSLLAQYTELCKQKDVLERTVNLEEKVVDHSLNISSQKRKI